MAYGGRNALGCFYVRINLKVGYLCLPTINLYFLSFKSFRELIKIIKRVLIQAILINCVFMFKTNKFLWQRKE